MSFNAAFEPLRMPLMVFLSGLLIPRSLSKGARSYVSGKLKNVLHPYFVWSAIFVVIMFGTRYMQGRNFDETMVGRVFYEPLVHMWFLAYLFIYYLVALLTRQVHPLILACAAILVSSMTDDGFWEKFWFLLGFFMIGVGLSRERQRWSRVVEHRTWLWAGAASFGVLFWLTWNLGGVRYEAATAPLVLACILGACLAIQSINSPKMLKAVRFLGKESLIYYVVHYAGIMVFLGVLRQVFVDIPEMVQFPVAAIAALVGSTLLVYLTRLVPGVSWLFRFGQVHRQRHPVGG
ncbi:acyltransferase family protein [Kocuria sp. KH4]